MTITICAGVSLSGYVNYVVDTIKNKPSTSVDSSSMKDFNEATFFDFHSSYQLTQTLDLSPMKARRKKNPALIQNQLTLRKRELYDSLKKKLSSCLREEFNEAEKDFPTQKSFSPTPLIIQSNPYYSVYSLLLR
jgi:hypothetical protein